MDRKALLEWCAKAGRKGSVNGARRGLPHGFAVAVAWALVATVLLPSDLAWAQQYVGSGKYGRSVIVNPEVLNSLGGGPMVQPLPFRPGTTAYYNPTVPYSPFGTAPQGSFPLARPGHLLFPPTQRPTSQLVAPAQQPQYASPAVPAYPVQPQVGLLPQPGAPASQEPQSQLLVPAPQAAFSPPPSPPEAPAEPVAAIAAVPAVPAQPQVPQSPAETVVPSSVETPKVVAAQPAPAVAATVPEAAPALPAVAATPSVEEEPKPAAQPSVPAQPAAPVEPAEAELPPPPEPEPVPAPSATAAAEPPPQPATPEPAPQAAAVPAAAEDPAARVLFDEGSAALSADGKSQLESLAQKLSANDSLRVQLLAFAAGDEDTANAARRLSLSRALVVRGFLIDQGIPSTRMQVRALGNKFESGPPDRVDIRPQSS